MAAIIILRASEENKARVIDAVEKNKFRFDWLTKLVIVKDRDSEIEINAGDCIKKVDVSGKALCSLCSDLIYYGSKGFSAISNHFKSKKHLDKEKTTRQNYSLPSNFFNLKKPATEENLGGMCSKAVQLPVKVPLCDRILNSQALVLGVTAEQNLPFTMAPVMIDVAKALAADRKALAHLSMDRTSASYKMRFGVAKTFFDQTTSALKYVPFSLNIDEATSNNYKRVICILVSYFSPALNEVVVEHLTSLNVVKVDAKTLYLCISNFFAKNNIPWENLISILMDSCSVMRGSKTGLETRIRKEKAPHLLNIDGDSCHHIHNACKKFCKPFESYIEKYFTDIYNDFKWSADQREALVEICQILGIKFTAIGNMVQHRWLSCYDVALSNLRIHDALTILYYGFVPSNQKHFYLDIIKNIYKERHVSQEGKQKFKEFWEKLEKKNMTEDGKRRKSRVVTKLFENSKKTLLIINFYIAVLPLLKKYVCLFQTKEPLIHKLFDEQKQLFLDFLSCFLKQEMFNDKSVEDLLRIDVSLHSNILQSKSMFLGSGTDSIISKSSQSDIVVKNFLGKATEAYIQCAKHLQKTLPLASELLMCISAIDPTARGHSLTLKRLKKLPELVTNVLCIEEREKYALEIHQYQVDEQLPSPLDEAGSLLRIDKWWAKLLALPKYTTLSKLVKALLSCFHGPQVESSFSMMDEILDKKSARMSIQTYSAIQTVKYKLKAHSKSAIQYFSKKDHLGEEIEPHLCQNLRTSRKNYYEEIEENKKQVADKMKKLAMEVIQSQSQRKSNEIVQLAEKKARLAHKRKLEVMCKQIQKKKSKFL